MRAAWLMVACSLLGCLAGEPSAGDRSVPIATPLGQDDADHERFLGTIELPLATIDARRIGPTPLTPARRGSEGQGVIVEFETHGLQGASGKLGLLAPRGAAHQEVAFEMPGQPDDPRSVWIDVSIDVDGAQRFELPSPGPDWHADWAVVALELRRGRTPLAVQVGPRSEMLTDQLRAPGARAILGVVPVARRPTRVHAAQLDAAATITLDGVLDEPVWQREGAVLLSSRTGEPSELDARVGGPTRVWFAWDDEHLFVAASLPDPDLHAPHHERDDPLYRDEAFELFIAADNSGTRYLEHEVSARNVVFDAHFPTYRKGNERWNGTWRSAVALDGELETRGHDRGWTVELAFAWSELCEQTNIQCPPKPGDLMRVNAYRLDKPDRQAQIGLALSPTLDPDFHAWSNAAELELLGPGASP